MGLFRLYWTKSPKRESFKYCIRTFSSPHIGHYIQAGMYCPILSANTFVVMVLHWSLELTINIQDLAIEIPFSILSTRYQFTLTLYMIALQV